MKNIGILDPMGENKNPLTNKVYQNLYLSEPTFEFPPNSNKKYEYSYKNISKIWTNLLVYKKRMEMINAFKKHKVTLIKAGTGVGKTVLVPKFALHAGNYKKKIVCCIPKKIITKETADFAAKCLDVQLGEHVGFYYKGEKKVDENNVETMLTFTTIGSLFSRLTGNDPLLEKYNTIIIDEAHERSIQTDFTLLLIKEVLRKRKDLKLIIMSATIDLNKFRNFYKEFNFGEVDAGSETTYKITDYYLDKEIRDWKKEVVNRLVQILSTTKKGDILVFVRSGNDGRELCNKLGKVINSAQYNPFCVELESKSADRIHPISKVPQSKYATHEILYQTHPDQDPNNLYTRKIVMSTNVAESSLTVKGIVYVIDSGLEFVSKYDPRTQSRSLLDSYIPQSAVKQRRGRAGRTQDGYCYHLYTQEQYDRFDMYPTPELQISDLSVEFLDILRMKSIGSITNLKKFLSQLIDPPITVFIKSGLDVLESLDAIKDNKITSLGLMITNFRGLKPMYAKSLITSYFQRCKRDVIDIIALLILLDGKFDELFKVHDEVKINKKFMNPGGDFLTLLKVVMEYNKFVYDEKAISRSTQKYKTVQTKNNNEIFNWCKKNHLNFRILRNVKKTAINLTQILNKVIKEYPDFKLETKKFNNYEDNIIYCLTHDVNTANHVRKNIYTTTLPPQLIEAMIDKNTTLTKSTNKIIYDELFLLKNGYRFKIVNII